MDILVTAREEIVTVIELQAREVVRLPRRRHTLRVLRGNAWVTDAHGDRLSWPGDTALLPPSAKVPAIVGGLGGSSLVLELIGEEAAWWSLQTYGAGQKRRAAAVSAALLPVSRMGRIRRIARDFWTCLRQRFGGRPKAGSPPCASMPC